MNRPRTLGRVWLATGALGAGAMAGLGGVDGRAGMIASTGALIALAARRRPLVRLVATAGAAFGLGTISGAVAVAGGSAVEAIASGVPHCDARGHIVESAGGLGTLVALDELRCDGRPVIRDAGTVVGDIPPADPGARVRISGWLVALGDESFDRARRRLGAGAAFELQEVEVGPIDGLLNRAAARFRGSLRAATSPLEIEDAVLARGLSIGDTSDMPPALESDLRRAGLSHLVAVSGTNVTIVLAAVMCAIRRLGSAARVAAGLCALGFYVLIVGPEPSVLRAAVMGGIGLAAVAYGRRTEPLNALGLALMAVVAIRPGLALSVGLHLSAAATAGIVLWTDRLVRAMATLPLLIAMPLAVTLAAQIAVAPLLVLVFGQLSLVAPLANLLAAPAVAPATVLALSAGAVGLVAPGMAVPLARLAGLFSGWIATVGDRLGEQPWAAIDVPPMWGWVLAASVIALAGVSLRREHRIPEVHTSWSVASLR